MALEVCMQTVAAPKTLVDAIFPPIMAGYRTRAIARDVVLMLGFAGFVALSAQISIRLPWTTVPITGQTFAVLVAGGALGAWRGMGCLSLYMLMGMVSIPVFAPGGAVTQGAWDVHFILPWSGTGGFIWDLTSGGYILGFIAAAGLVGSLAERGWDRKPWVHPGMFIANAVIYIPGLLWLAYLIGSGWIYPGVDKPLADLIPGDGGTWDKTLIAGLYPFVVGDLMKLFLASITLPVAWKLVERFKFSRDG